MGGLVLGGAAVGAARQRPGCTAPHRSSIGSSPLSPMPLVDSARERSTAPIPYIASLDGLRGWAITAVIAYHVVRVAGSEGTVDRVLTALAGVGWMGVDLFFVLSGYLITRVLLAHRDSSSYFRAFYIRRALRIVPVYYVTLAVLFWVVPAVAPSLSPKYETFLAHQEWYWGYVANWFIVIHKLNATPLSTTHLWSLSVEEQFYLAWPLIVWAVPPRRLARVCLVGAVGVLVLRIWLRAHGAGFNPPYYSTPTRLDTLLLGAWLACMGARGDFAALARKWAPMLLCSALCALAAIAVTHDGQLARASGVMVTYGFSVVACANVALLAWVLATDGRGPIAQRTLGPTMRSIGRYSYAIYLFHDLLFGLFQYAGLSVERFPRLAGTELPGLVAMFVLVYGSAWILARVSWQVLEAPLMRLKSRVPYEPSAGRAVAAAGAG